MAFDAKGVRFLPLADGWGESHVSCVHLGAGAKIEAPSLTHAAALMVVHGLGQHRDSLASKPNSNSRRHGLRIQASEPYSLLSELGAVILIFEAEELVPHVRGISSQTGLPARDGQQVPKWTGLAALLVFVYAIRIRLCDLGFSWHSKCGRRSHPANKTLPLCREDRQGLRDPTESVGPYFIA